MVCEHQAMQDRTNGFTHAVNKQTHNVMQLLKPNNLKVND